MSTIAGSHPDYGGRVMVALGAVPLTSDTDGRVWVFHLSDHVKSSAHTVLPRISGKAPIFMLTGDTLENAESVTNRLGDQVRFAGVHANLLPAEKLELVQDIDTSLRAAALETGSLKTSLLHSLGVSIGGLMMVGDGVNDAPALAAASVGISLASQADGAIPTSSVEGSDVIILGRASDPTGETDLQMVEWTLALSRKASNLLQQNLCLALASILGASACALAANLPLWLGVVLHEGATVMVALNSLRLLRPFNVGGQRILADYDSSTSGRLP